VSWSGNPAFSIKEIPRDSCSSTRLGTHRYSGDDSQSGRGTQANTYSDRTRPQGASSDPGEGARHSTSCLQRGTERAIRSRWSGHGATSPRASNSLKRSLPNHASFSSADCCKRRRCVLAIFGVRVAPAHDEPRSGSNNSAHESTSGRSTNYGSGHLIRVFRDIGRIVS
jgi:hypothetical protein